MAKEIIPADKARKLAAEFDLNIDQLIERIASKIERHAKLGNTELTRVYKKQAVSPDELEKLKQAITDKGYQIEDKSQSGKEVYRIKISWDD
ncbi:MAG: hypothetical protein WD059_04650 [Balneolaceae bacterium]